ncbi:hypothetical protein M0812_02050 [Anaeramoeba flamelloides]|uniref:Uncharacterized protein n=1 Tax=Anaeramoeba flamelloides TaxID=1746091 RepID=A0AAV7YYW7_9EUKA|nr:hypothetical protein M0812_02050 [Anaeramoeba flamelloides]
MKDAFQVYPRDIPEMQSDADMKMPYITSHLSVYKTVRYGKAIPFNATPLKNDSITCFVEKGWKYSANDHKYPELTLKLKIDTSGYSAANVFQYILGFLYSIPILFTVKHIKNRGYF